MKFTEALTNISYYALIEQSPLPTLWLDMHGAVIHANTAAADFLEYSLEELVKMSLKDIDTSYSAEKFAEMTREMAQNPIVRFEAVHRKKDGQLVDVEIIRNFVNEDGNKMIVSYIFDITEKKESERRLNDIKKLLDFSKDLIVISTAEDLKIIYVNEQTCASLGYSGEELLSMDIPDIVQLDISVLEEYRQTLLKDGKLASYDTLVRKDGSAFPVETSVNLVQSGGVMYTVAISRDITDRLAKEQELKQKTDALEELNKTLEKKVYERTIELENHKAQLEERVKEEISLRRKQESVIFAQQKFVDMGKMLNAVAHHWRQPINALGLMIQEVGEVYQEEQMTPEFITYFTETAMRVVGQMSSTIDQFKTFYQPENNKKQFEVFKTISDLINLIKIQMYRKNINMKMTCTCHKTTAGCDDGFILPECGNMRTLVYGYEEELKQVIMNLVDNSAEAITARYGTTTTNAGLITISLVTTENDINITVADNGRGISDDIAEKIFDPYFTTKKDAKSTGLGLFMSKVIVEDHFNGQIKAENTENGASVSITIPLNT